MGGCNFTTVVISSHVSKCKHITVCAGVECSSQALRLPHVSATSCIQAGFRRENFHFTEKVGLLAAVIPEARVVLLEMLALLSEFASLGTLNICCSCSIPLLMWSASQHTHQHAEKAM